MDSSWGQIRAPRGGNGEGFLPQIFLASLRVGSWGPIRKQRGVIPAVKEMRTDNGVTYLIWRFREGVLEEVDSQKGSKG